MEIKKKIWPEYFEKIKSGDKSFELRLADWDCNVGDILVLQEWNPKNKQYTGRELTKTVSYVLKTKEIEKLTMWPKEEIDRYGFQIISLK
jgi:ASC-1-like (ASCH) protein